MFNRIKQFFTRSKPQPEEDPTEKIAAEWDETKSKFMQVFLGREHDMVMHAIIPFAVGGTLDLYYYLDMIPGTTIATKELTTLPAEGSSNRIFACYEIAMFTRHELNLELARNKSTPFGHAHSTINHILNCIGPYSADVMLNPNETCEFPADMPDVGGKCLIFDAYGVQNLEERQLFGIMAIIEIHRSEMDFARAEGGAKLIERLKEAGHYPYSDLDRQPVA